MKSSEEMVTSLFERRAQYDAKQKQKKKIFIRAGAVLKTLQPDLKDHPYIL